MPTYSDILSAAGRTVSGVSAAASSISSILNSSAEGSPNYIRGLYTNGFIGSPAMFTPNVFSRLFDEPTYLTFRIEFDFNVDNIENNAPTSKEKYGYETFDYMPQPLLSLGDQTLVQIGTKNIGGQDNPTSGLYDEMTAVKLVNNYSTGIKMPIYRVGKSYSAYRYLRDVVGDDQRADMMFTFVNALKDIQDNYPYYFTSIEGLGDLLKVEPSAGIRIKDNEGILTLKCYEGLDLKVTQIAQLYRKIVWDDVYQRWILPDMMRYFHMKIYVSEIRLFHSASKSMSEPKKSRLYDIANMVNATSYDEAFSSFNALNNLDNLLNNASLISARFLGTDSALTNTVNSVNQTIDTIQSAIGDIKSDFTYLCNNAINDVMPTICIDCGMCEFVIDDTLGHINSLSSAKSTEFTQPSLKIRVGKVLDSQAYPLNVGLRTTSDGYSMLTDDSESNTPANAYMGGAYFSDAELMRSSHVSRYSNYGNRGNKMTATERITAAFRRINRSINGASNDSADLRYRLARSQAGTAVLRLVQGVLNQFTPAEVLSAATSLSEISNFVRNSDIVKSSATSEEQRDKLAEMSVIAALDNISRSEATRDTALGALAFSIVNNYGDIRSMATDEDNEITDVFIEQGDTVSSATDNQNEIQSDIQTTEYTSYATDESRNITQENVRTEEFSEATASDNTIEFKTERPDYVSTATEQSDKIESDMPDSPYFSTATEEEQQIESDIDKSEYASSATAEDNMIESDMPDTPYFSTATEEDQDMEFDGSPTQYESTATADDNTIEALTERPEEFSEATSDGNTIESDMPDTPYASTATEEDQDMEFDGEHSEYVSTATEDDNTIEPGEKRSEEFSTATADSNMIESDMPDTTYVSTATEEGQELEFDGESTEYSSKATDENNNIQYSGRTEYISTATTDRKITGFSPLNT